MIDKDYDAHERVEHRHISTEKSSNRHRDKQPVYHHKSLHWFPQLPSNY
jgi:hypothetical protein